MQCVPVLFPFYKQTIFKWRLEYWWFCFISVCFHNLEHSVWCCLMSLLLLVMHELLVISVSDTVLLSFSLQDWAQGEVFPLWEMQSVSSPGSAGEPQGDYHALSDRLRTHLMSKQMSWLLVFCYVSVCWKCVSTELPSVYGGMGWCDVIMY